jgi:hypothetical protein
VRHLGETTRLHGLAAAVFVLSTVALLGPALGDARWTLGPGHGDPLLNVYFLEWGAHQVSLGLPDPWSPPFFYPTKRALTLSDHLLGPAVPFCGLRKAGLAPAGAYNCLLVAAFALSGWMAAWVLRRTGLSFGGAMVGGWVFAFSGFRWSEIGHFQVVRMQWIPLVLWTFDRVLERPTGARALAFLIFYALHVSGGAYLAFLIHLPLAVLVVNRWLASGRTSFAPARLRVLLPAGASALAIVTSFYAPYVDTGVGLGGRHSETEMRRHGAVLASFVTPAGVALESRLLPFLPRETGRGAFFPGVTALGLMAMALVPRRRRRPPSMPGTGRLAARGLFAAAGVVLAAGGLALADRVTLGGEGESYTIPRGLTLLGAAMALAAWRASGDGRARADSQSLWPRGLVASGALMVLLCLPLFFSAARAVVPGMAPLRVPTRAFALAAFPFAFLVASGWDRVTNLVRHRGMWAPITVIVALALVVESLPRLPPWRPIPAPAAFPAYTRWIERHPEVGAYLELPLGREPYWEAAPMYLETLHWRPLANGYSAVLPTSFREIAHLCRPFPDANGLERLAELGLTHIVVHSVFPPWYPGPTIRRRVARFLPAFEQQLAEIGARCVFSEPGTHVYELPAAARRASRENPGAATGWPAVKCREGAP